MTVTRNKQSASWDGSNSQANRVPQTVDTSCGEKLGPHLCGWLEVVRGQPYDEVCLNENNVFFSRVLHSQW
jgi:hypothetical protein